MGGITALSQRQQEALAERAAIREYEANETREEAESAALLEQLIEESEDE